MNKKDKVTRNESKKKEVKEKKESIDEKLEKVIAIYNQEYAILNDIGIELFYFRNKTIKLIEDVEYLINSIANHPKEFDKELLEINVIKDGFKQKCDFAREELEVTQKSAIGAGVGISGGIAICNLAPTAAMWVATTFGTASTGTAISTLSGAAATNAALAWLGGGTVATGGLGVAGGNALLALAGPVGLSVAGASLLASIIILNRKKIKIKKEKIEEIERIELNTQKVKETSQKIKLLLEENKELYNNINSNYRKALYVFNKDYITINDENRLLLGSIVNETKAIAKLIEKGIE